MIKFSGETGDGRSVYFFGLSRANIDRLTAGDPIKANLADMGGPRVEVAILFGETEQSLFDDLKAAGMIPDGLEYRVAVPGTAEVVRFRRR